MKKFAVACLFILGFILLETGILSNMLFLPAVPDFVLLCSLYFSLQNGRLFGVSAGFTGGILLDFLTACPFGFNSLLRTVLGYGAGFFNKTLNIKGIFFPVLLGAVFTLSKALAVHVISAFYPNISVSYRIFSSSFGFELLFNSLLTPVIFRFLDVFKDYLILTPEKVS